MTRTSILLLFAIAPSMSIAEEKVTQEIVDALVDRLVSPNPAPDIPASKAKYPPGYDKAAQKDVSRAYSELCNLGPAAFPFLFDHFTDRRYSLTADAGSAERNFTVGNLCYQAIALQLQPYGNFTAGEGDPRSRKRRPSYLKHIQLRDPEAARKWWKSHDKLTLREMQIEVLKWVIEEEAETPDEYEDDEREWLSDTLESLKKSDKPMRRGSPWAK